MKTLLALILVFLDAAPVPATVSGGFLPWLLIGVLVICVAVAVWTFLKKKKK